MARCGQVLPSGSRLWPDRRETEQGLEPLAHHVSPSPWPAPSLRPLSLSPGPPPSRPFLCHHRQHHGDTHDISLSACTRDFVLHQDRTLPLPGPLSLSRERGTFRKLHAAEGRKHSVVWSHSLEPA